MSLHPIYLYFPCPQLSQLLSCCTCVRGLTATVWSSGTLLSERRVLENGSRRTGLVLELERFWFPLCKD